MNKQQLADYLDRKHESLEFWEALREVVPSEQVICSLKYQIREAEKQINEMEGYKNGINKRTIYRKSHYCT